MNIAYEYDAAGSGAQLMPGDTLEINIARKVGRFLYSKAGSLADHI